MKPRMVRAKKEPLPRESCALCMDWHEKGKHNRVVWAVGHDDKPIGKYGTPKATQREADQLAEDRARAGVDDQVVSVGMDPKIKGFKITRRYEARTGRRII